MARPPSMGGFLARRAVTGALTIVAVPALSFLFWTAQIEDGPWDLGGDHPSVLGRLSTYLQDTFLHFDLGRSTEASAQPVSLEIRDGFPIDLTLLLGALLIGAAAGVLGGLACAHLGGSPGARLLRGGATLAICVPAYTGALFVLLLFSSNTGHLPLPFVSGSGQYVPLRADPLGWLRAIWVPCAVLSAPVAAACLRLTEAMLREHAGETFAQTARAKGVAERVVLRRHVLPVAAPPVVAFVGASIGVLVLNVALVEVAFSMNGSFRHVRTAVTRLDLPMVQGMVLVATALVVIGNTIADAILLVFERRMRD